MVSFRKSVLSLGIAVSALLCPLHASYADPACDATFLTDMENRAWAEAQREIMIAQSTIAKPDSVFDLTCFNGLIYGIPDSSFADSDWTTDRGDLMGVVTDYLSVSFAHALGGGHDSTVSKSLNDQTCGVMIELWNDARCADLTTARILTLADATGYDRGAYPLACAAPASLTDATNLTSTFDAMNLFLDVTAPLSETTGTRCSAGINTGVIVGTGTDPEIVCPNPGCSPTGGDSPQCCQTGTTSGASCT